MEFWVRRWREELWRGLGDARKILELGVGTGKNIPFYPHGVDMTAIDISERMLAEAKRRAARHGAAVELQLADAQELPFRDATFDFAVATFVFRSVPDAVKGLRETRRVLKPGGRLLMVERVLTNRPMLRQLMLWLDPLTHRLLGCAHQSRCARKCGGCRICSGNGGRSRDRCRQAH